MKFLKGVALILTVVLVFSGCSTVASVIGTLSIDVDSVTKLEVTASSGETFTVQDQDSVRTVVNYINVLKLETETEPVNGFAYTVKLVGADTTVTIVDAKTVSHGGVTYSVDASSLLYCIQKLEAETMTDKELIRQIFEVEYEVFTDLTDADGNFSLDKLLKLKDNCPATFELIGRSSALESLSSYGLDLLAEYAESGSAALRQRALDIAAFLKAQFPTLEDEVEEIVEN